MGVERVTVDNFVRVETEKMFASLLSQSGDAVNTWSHNRAPTPLDQQPVIRMNRDTLYSAAIANISGGATLTIPDAGERYLSVMAVNQDHYINRVFHEAGEHELTMDEFDTPFLTLATRILVDPTDSGDIAQVNKLQDQLALSANSSEVLPVGQYEEESYKKTRNAILQLARDVTDFSDAFGSKENVDPIHHLLATASGWGGLPSSEAVYVNVDRDLPVGEYRIEVGEVPVDAFWSISLYNKEGYFEENDRNMYSVNSLTATKNDEGTITVYFGTSAEEKPNYFPIDEGWNYIVRMYRPRPEIIDGSWTFPHVQPA